MVILTIYIMGLIVALHIFIVAAIREFKTLDCKYDEYDLYGLATFLSFVWPIVLLYWIIFGFIILASKWFKFVYSIVYKEEDGTDTP